MILNDLFQKETIILVISTLNNEISFEDDTIRKSDAKHVN